MTAKREIVPGRVYVARRKSGRSFRRVISVIGNWVLYSSGGDRNYSCTLRAFKRATLPQTVDDYDRVKPFDCVIPPQADLFRAP